MRYPKKEKLDLPPRQNCWICGKPGEWDHLRTRGAGGGNEMQNLQPLDRYHHVERHTMSLKDFVKKYNLPISWESGWPRRMDLKPDK